ncbi:MAG TPA: hypothetical protein PLC58_15115, partial [Denitromonas sp.]|nr:hypothetical protein [Denitromonas sp.]
QIDVDPTGHTYTHRRHKNVSSFLGNVSYVAVDFCRFNQFSPVASHRLGLAHSVSAADARCRALIESVPLP